jgi:hypothetical protein
MSQIDRLVEQHFLESQSHLRHIDELMAKAREARASKLVSAEHEGQLSRLEQDHARVAGELHALRGKPATPEAVEHSKGLTGMLKTIGLELEKALTAIGDKSGL